MVGSTTTKLDIYFRNGSRDTYDLLEYGYDYRLSSRKDATTQGLTFTYDDPDSASALRRLTRVTTADGAQFNFAYTDGTDVYRITGVTGPNSRSVSFGYTTISSVKVLTSITDAVGMVSSFGWDQTKWWINSLTTPYGTTSFNHFDAGICNPVHPNDGLTCVGIDRSITITEPDGSRQFYLLYDNPYNFLGTASQVASKVPSAFSSGQLPQYVAGSPPIQTLDTGYRDQRNSHYWNRQQAAQLPGTLTLANLTAAHFLVSRTRHWLMEYNDFGTLHTMSWELPPSQDGVNEAMPVFYDYKQKPTGNAGTYPDSAYCGTNNLLSVIARRVPDGANITTAYTYFERNSLGMNTNVIEGRIKNGAATTYRTNSFTYASGTGNPAVDGLLLVQQKGPYGEFILGRALHSTFNDQIRYETNAVGEVTTFDYDSFRRLSTRQTHAGLLLTYTYNATDKRLQTVVDTVSGVPVRTNSYTWLNGYLRTHTDARGFTRTFDFDFLGRPTQITYPDSTTEAFAYSLPASTGFNTSGSSLALLDLVTRKDRLGNYSRTLLNRLRQIEKIIEPSQTTPGQYGTETTLTYCGCGSPTAITRGSNTGAPETTSFDYTYQGGVKKITFPNSTTLTNKYDALGRLSSREDAFLQVTNTYDYLSRVLVVSNAAGLMQGLGYDLRDRVVASTNSSGIWMTNQFDALVRTLVRGYPDGGKEQWSYTAGFAGATVYTNQISTVTTWVYDASQRLLKEALAGSYTNTFAYSPANDLVQLVDGKNQQTLWQFDGEGRMITKTNQSNVKMLTLAYDANSRLTNRWSVATGTTSYRYDGVGNLTLVDYPSGTADITNQFNALHRLTSMIDGVGTTAFTYNTAGDLTGEDGPWAGDTVTRGYHASVPHLRASLVTQRPYASDWTQSYGYDAAKRLTSLTSGAGAFTYAYRGGASELIDKLTLANTSYITNTYNSVGRQLSTILKNRGHTALNSHAYLYNLAGHRTKQTLTAGNYWDYGYDAREQLTVARGYESGGSTARNQEQFLYAYDAAANLTTRSNNALRLSFTLSNPRNELTSASRAGTLTVAGYTGGAATGVTVADNGNAAQAAARYGDNAFARAGVSALNGNNTFTAVATDALGRGDTNVVATYLPATVNFGYDSNGNLTGDGRRTLTYDAENQLSSATVTNVGAGTSTKSEFVYDGLRRLRVSKEYLWSGSAFTLVSEIRRVYDGWLVIQERDANNLPTITYTRGLDLSGTLDGAGGIGGLLARTDHASGSSAVYHADGSGNVTALLDAAQSLAARYSYDPFGNPLGKFGPLADANVYRSSSKEWHECTGLVYYGFRFYEPSLQRWLNQDPLGEAEGSNLYSYVGNGPVGQIDPFGLYETDFHYYAIYYIFRAKGYSPTEANEVAWASQHIDDNPATEPIYTTPPVRALFHFHGCGPEKATSRNPLDLAEQIRALLRESSPRLNDVGTLLHTYADSWSHEGFTAWHNDRINRRTGSTRPNIGHADAPEGGHAPDRPYNDVRKALEAATTIYGLIPDKHGGAGLRRDLLERDLRRAFSFRAEDLDLRVRNFQAVIKRRFGDNAQY